MPDHISIDELADAAEGLLDPARSGAVDAHLGDCTACRAQVQALGRVRAMLAAEPAPTMPPQVQARLAAVLEREVADRAAGVRSLPVQGPVQGPGQPGQGPVPPGQLRRPKPSLGVFGADLARPAKRRWLVPALAAAAVATLVGFGGYVLSASAGLNEPPTVSAAVNTKELGPDARALEQGVDLDPHRFSRAWQCARKVTDGRIFGLASTTVDGVPSLLVYTRSSGQTMVTVVTGCDQTPTPGPSAAVSR